MGQQRTDTNQQLEAKRRGAERRRCKHCGRKNAMSDMSSEFQYARQCRYCGYAHGRFYDTGEKWEEISKA